MSDEEEIVGSDFIGSDDEEKSVEALELKLQKILQEKEKLEKQKKKDEILLKIKQAEAALSNLQTSAEPSKSEIDSWTTDEIRQFFRRKGIIVKNKPLEHLRKLAKSVIDSRIPDHKTTAPSEISKRTINNNGKDLIFPGIKDKSLSNWSDDISCLPSVDHVQAHAYIISSAEFDLERFRNIKKEDSFLLYKGNAIKKFKVHKLDEGFCYVTCNCMSSQNSQTNLEVVWSLIQNDGCIQTAGCSCDEGSDCCRHTIALMLTLASLNKSNNYAADKVVDIMDTEDNAQLLTNPDALKPKVSRKGRLTAINLNQYFQGKTVSDINRQSPNKILTATKAQIITYDRKFQSVFSQRRPDNIGHIPEIQVDSELDETPVTGRSFTFTPGYVKGASKALAPVTDKPAVRSKPKPKPKRTQSPAADAPPGAVTTQPQITTEEIMRKAIGAINMVKHGCDAAMVVKVISDLPINTEDALSRIVNLVVDTAVDDPSCLSVCTSLCRILSRAKVQSMNDPGESVTFSTAYRQKCTKEIEQGILSRSTESYNRRIEEIARITLTNILK